MPLRMPVLRRSGAVVAWPPISPTPPSWDSPNTLRDDHVSPNTLHTRFESIDRSGATLLQRVKASADSIHMLTDGQSAGDAMAATPPHDAQSQGLGFIAHRGEFSQTNFDESLESPPAHASHPQHVTLSGIPAGPNPNDADGDGPAKECRKRPAEEESAGDGDAPDKKRRKRYTEEEIVKMFQDATKNWNIHSYVGNWWQKQFKDDPELKAELKSQPDVPAKKAFREKKIKEKLTALEEHYCEEYIEEGGQELQGQYLCFTRIWEE